MTRTARTAACALSVLVALALGGCFDSGDHGSAGPGATLTSGGDTRSRVAVDTPELRKLKSAAGIEPCRPGRPSGSTATDDASGRPEAGSSLPAVELACLGGGRDVRLSGLRGEPTVINLWASWCKRCREELAHLQRLHEDGAGSVRVIGIDFQDGAPASALRLAADSGVTYPLLADPAGETRKDLGVIGLPQTIFVDRSGRIVATERRAVTSYGQLVDLVRKHLKVTP